MEAITSKSLDQKLVSRDRLVIVFVYTPLCGTCKLAEKMLKVVQASFDSLPIYSLNINHSPEFAQKWKIKSVPCLLVFQKGLGVECLYAFQSIANVHEKLKPYAVAWSLQENGK